MNKQFAESLVFTEEHSGLDIHIITVRTNLESSIRYTTSLDDKHCAAKYKAAKRQAVQNLYDVILVKDVIDSEQNIVKLIHEVQNSDILATQKIRITQYCHQLLASLRDIYILQISD